MVAEFKGRKSVKGMVKAETVLGAILSGSAVAAPRQKGKLKIIE